jgi:hypothetical protein
MTARKNGGFAWHDVREVTTKQVFVMHGAYGRPMRRGSRVSRMNEETRAA